MTALPPFARRCASFCIALLAAFCSAPGQQTAPLPAHDIGGIIDTILISGNDRTKDYVITNEMSLKPGMRATPEAMEYDRNRIYSLGLFTDVEISYDSLKSIHFVFVEVNERWYIIPFPEFGFRDGDPKKPYYGAGFLDYNFRGRNQKLFGEIAFGYDPSLALSFTDPLFIQGDQVYLSSSMSTSQVHNRSTLDAAAHGDFDERHYDANTTIGKRFSLFETSGINIGYQIVKVSSYYPGRTASPRGMDKYLYATVDYAYDSRDLREYPMSGEYYSAYINRNGFGESHVNYFRMGVDLRRYTPLPFDMSFVTRIFGSLVAGGTVPTYGRTYLGYGERVRGYFRTVFEGEDLAGASCEIRYPLLKARTFVFDALPIPPEFSVWRFGMSLALFADAGTAWFRGAPPRLTSFASGYGAGVAFLLPYSFVIQTEYALNNLGAGQFILDLRRPI